MKGCKGHNDRSYNAARDAITGVEGGGIGGGGSDANGIWGHEMDLSTDKGKCDNGSGSCDSRDKLHVATILGEDGGNDSEKNVRRYG